MYSDRALSSESEEADCFCHTSAASSPVEATLPAIDPSVRRFCVGKAALISCSTAICAAHWRTSSVPCLNIASRRIWVSCFMHGKFAPNARLVEESRPWRRSGIPVHCDGNGGLGSAEGPHQSGPDAEGFDRPGTEAASSIGAKARSSSAQQERAQQPPLYHRV